MERKPSRLTVAVCAATAILAGIASGAGILFRGDLATERFTTVRGDTFEILTNGIYRFNGQNVAAEGIGWDIVTLLLVVPAMLLVLPALRRGSTRAALVATGLLSYFLYQYFEYATFLAYGPLFLLYVGISGLSVTGLALIIGGIDFAALPARFGPTFPRRGVTGFGIFMAVLLGGLWLPLVLSTMTAQSVHDLHGATTLVVQAFDLGLLVPLGLLTAVATYRRLAVGYLLAAAVVVKGLAMGTAIVAMLIVEGAVNSAYQLPPIAIFAAIAVASAYLGARVIGSVDTDASHQRTAMAHPAPTHA